MINLTGKSVIVKTQKEYLSVLKIAKLQGFTWSRGNHLNPIKIPFPNILDFNENKNVTCRDFGKTLYEASELFETKEMTAREFAEWYANTCSLCKNRECSKCVLSKKNTKRNESLCEIANWKDNIDEILEIAASGRITVLSPERKAISTLESFIENPDRAALNDEFVEALKLAVEKLKEVK